MSLDAAQVVAGRCFEVDAGLERLGGEWQVAAERDLGWRGERLTWSARGNGWSACARRCSAPTSGATPPWSRSLPWPRRATTASTSPGPSCAAAWLPPAGRGRLEVVAGTPRVFIDGAHNPDAVASVVATTRGLAQGRPVTPLRRDGRQGLAGNAGPAAARVARRLHRGGRGQGRVRPLSCSLKPAAWAATATPLSPGSALALRAASAQAGTRGLVLVLGSLYLAGAARDALHLPGLEGDRPSAAREAATLVTFDAAATGVAEVARGLRQVSAARIPGVVDLVPGPPHLLVRFDPRVATREALERAVVDALATAGAELETPAASHQIPVDYGGDAGPDLEAAAAHLGMSPEALVRRHLAAGMSSARPVSPPVRLPRRPRPGPSPAPPR